MFYEAYLKERREPFDFKTGISGFIMVSTHWEHSFPKNRCSVTPGYLPLERPKNNVFHLFSNRIFRTLLVNSKYPPTVSKVTKDKEKNCTFWATALGSCNCPKSAWWTSKLTCGTTAVCKSNVTKVVKVINVEIWWPSGLHIRGLGSSLVFALFL